MPEDYMKIEEIEVDEADFIKEFEEKIVNIIKDKK